MDDPPTTDPAAPVGALFDAVLERAAGPALPFVELGTFWDAHRAETAGWSRPIDRAALGGAAADRLGSAFVAGYQAALRALVPSLEEDRLASLCATEASGVHPSRLATLLVPNASGGFTLTGEKQWATAAGPRSRLLIVATLGRDERGRNRLRVARVQGDAEGVTLEELPPTPFIPEIPHARVRLEGVRVARDALLDGDGYDDVLKPFRTVEDLHVTAATLGYLLRVALAANWDEATVEHLLGALAAARSLVAAPPASPGVQLAVAGLLTEQKRFLAEAAPLWERVDEPVRARWRRDVALLDVAATARERRRTAAWERVRRVLASA
jgi:acyl-CoA dehydrogenase